MAKGMMMLHFPMQPEAKTEKFNMPCFNL